MSVITVEALDKNGIIFLQQPGFLDSDEIILQHKYKFNLSVW